MFSGIQPDDPATRAPRAGEGGAQNGKTGSADPARFRQGGGRRRGRDGGRPVDLRPEAGPGRPKELKILVWSHFVPRFDKEWYDGYAQKWGQANGIKVTVDHIGLAEIASRTAAEISAGQGHDLIEWIAPPSQFEPSVLDLTDVVKEAEKRYGKQHPLCRKSSFNPNSKKFYCFCPGWTIDPGSYRKSLWEKAGKRAGRRRGRT